MSDEPTNADLQRQITSTKADLVAAIANVSLQLGSFVPRDLHRAEYGAILDKVIALKVDLDALEKQVDEDRKAERAEDLANRQTSRNAKLTAIGALVGAIALEALKSWLRIGGH